MERKNAPPKKIIGRDDGDGEYASSTRDGELGVQCGLHGSHTSRRTLEDNWSGDPAVCVSESPVCLVMPESRTLGNRQSVAQCGVGYRLQRGSQPRSRWHRIVTRGSPQVANFSGLRKITKFEPLKVKRKNQLRRDSKRADEVGCRGYSVNNLRSRRPRRTSSVGKNRKTSTCAV